MSTRNGGAAVVETLAAHGVDTVFGIPGTHNLELYRHLAACRDPAGHAPARAGRRVRRRGVRAGLRPARRRAHDRGPGLTNAMTAAATAYAESRPVLVVSPGVRRPAPRARDLGLLHETKDSSAASADRRALEPPGHHSRRGRRRRHRGVRRVPGTRPRPVHVEIPVDVLEQPWGRQPVGRGRHRPPAPDAADVRRAAALLAGARRPLVIAGGGAVDAAAEVRALAEALGAPVATTVNGKGVLDESHPLAVGAAVRLRALQKAAADSDAPARRRQRARATRTCGRAGSPRQTVIRCDIEPAQLHKNCRADVALLGDAATTLSAVSECLQSHFQDAGSPESGSAYPPAGSAGLPSPG